MIAQAKHNRAHLSKFKTAVFPGSQGTKFITTATYNASTQQIYFVCPLTKKLVRVCVFSFFCRVFLEEEETPHSRLLFV